MDNMPVWEKIFCERYPHKSFQEAIDVIMWELNQYSTGDCYLNDGDRCNLLSRKCLPGGRYFANIRAPKNKRQLSNCFAMRAEDNRESWAKVLHDIAMYTMYGGGVGVDYSALRPNGTPTATPGQNAGGPCSLIRATDRMVEQLRSCRRGALLAQLAWDHPDIEEFFALKAKDDKQLSRTNISVKYDARWHDIIDQGESHPEFAKAISILTKNVGLAVSAGEPGMMFNGRKLQPFGELCNACSELRTDTDHDSCNIGGIFFTNFTHEDLSDENEIRSVTGTMNKLLLLGTKASILTTQEALDVRAQNNRLLIGYGGLWPFYSMYGKARTREVLMQFRSIITEQANYFSAQMGMATPVATTGIAPHGSIGIFAETTGGIEPPFAEATLRRIQNGLERPRIHVMVDPTFKKLHERGLRCKSAQDIGFEERLEFQAFVQDHIDMGVSSTVNLKKRGTPGNDMPVEDMVAIILKYHRRLAGLTMYPDGAIEGQPLTPISYEEALKYGDGKIVDDTESLLALSELLCKSGICGQ